MTRILPLDALRTAPARDRVLRTQGIPEGHEVPERVGALVAEAVSLYERLAEPRGLTGEISREAFQEVYRGEGRNAEPSPLPRIVAGGQRLALFVMTLGDAVCQAIGELFAANDPALATMLDGIASERADAGATLLAEHFRDELLQEGTPGPETRVLPYSPGYCGWHVSGQRRLFDVLRPERIGVTLNPSFLMSPLKSVSGVLVAGPASAHAFRNDFDFCLDCRTFECRARIAALRSKDHDSSHWS